MTERGVRRLLIVVAVVVGTYDAFYIYMLWQLAR